MVEIGQTARLSALSSFSEMALFEKQGGETWRMGSVSVNQSPGAPLNDHFPKAPHFRPLWGTEFLSQP